MQKELTITIEQLATLLWIKVLDDFEDDINITLKDKYYNFIENNSVIEGMESSEFDKNKEFLVEHEFLMENNENIEFTKKGIEVVELVVRTKNENGIQPFENKKNKMITYEEIKKIIDENSNVIQLALTALSILISIFK